MNTSYNVKEVVDVVITADDLKDIINKKLLNIILFMENMLSDDN